MPRQYDSIQWVRCIFPTGESMVLHFYTMTPDHPPTMTPDHQHFNHGVSPIYKNATIWGFCLPGQYTLDNTLLGLNPHTFIWLALDVYTNIFTYRSMSHSSYRSHFFRCLHITFLVSFEGSLLTFLFFSLELLKTHLCVTFCVSKWRGINIIRLMPS